MNSYHSYAPADGHGLRFNPFKAIVAPRPIGWISTVDAEGNVNLAPYSFFNAVSETPPVIMFSSSGRKDSLTNIEATGEFGYNLATAGLAEQMRISGAPFEAGIDELAKAGLTPVKGEVIAAPLVGESPASFECKLTEIRQVRDSAGEKTSNYMVFGEVVRVHIKTEFLTDGRFDIVKAGTLARAGYRDYTEVDRIIEILPYPV